MQAPTTTVHAVPSGTPVFANAPESLVAVALSVTAGLAPGLAEVPSAVALDVAGSAVRVVGDVEDEEVVGVEVVVEVGVAVVVAPMENEAEISLGAVKSF